MRFMDETLANTTTPGQSEHRRKGNPKVTLHYLELQTSSITTKGISVPYTRL